MNNPRNLIVAIALSVAIIALWQIFVLEPMAERRREALERQQAEQAAQTAETLTADTPSAAPQAPEAGGPVSPSAGPAGPPAEAAALSREDALRGAPRLSIQNDKVGGTLRLQGARFDDLQLHGYRETIDPASPEIVLFAPADTAQSYFAEFGWLAPQGTAVALPGAETVWTAQGSELAPGRPVILTWDNGQGLTFTREVLLDENYMFVIHDKVTNTGGAPVKLFPYGLVQREGLPPGQQTWILHEGLLGVFDGSLTTATYAEMAETRAQSADSTGGWFGITDKYWMAAVAPGQQTLVVASFAERGRGGPPVFQADYIHKDPIEIPPGSSAEVTHHLFAGAKVVRIVDSYAEEGGLGLTRFDLAVDWGWFFIITKPIFWVLDQIFLLVGNFGVAIILLTILIKIAFYPLANRSYEAMTKMKKVQPEMMRLRDLYKNDPTELQKQMMELYRKEKVNPLMGCLPVLIQIPVFFSLYKVLFVTIEMRHAPFFGWIQDLSAPDPTSLFNLFGLLPFEVPLYLQFGIWPLLMGVTMWAQMKMNPPPTDPVQQKIFAFMPWIFTVLLATFPAGLVIYWTVNNLLSILQQYVIMRRLGVEVEFLDGLKMPAWAKALLDRRRSGDAEPPAG